MARVVALAIPLLLAACQSAVPPTSPDPGGLRGDWLVVEVNGTQAREFPIIVTFEDGKVDTNNVCNGFTVSYGYGDAIIQRLPPNTTVTYGGVGCVTGDDIDNDLLGLLYFNPDPTSFTIDGERLQLVSGQLMAELVR